MKIPMRFRRTKIGNTGFSHAELFIVVVVIAIVAFIGDRVLQMSHAQTTNAGYHVVGNNIVGPSGKNWAPYGFVLECLAYKDPYSSCDKSTNSDTDKIKAIASFWHGNTVRLQVAPENLLDKSPYDSKFMGVMDSEVKLANSLGLTVILALQQEEYKGPIFETQQSVTFWNVMANHYKNNPDVMFDMYNEPAISPSNSGSVSNMWNIWQSGGTAKDGTKYVGYQTIVNTIRSDGANNIVIAESPETDSDLSGVPTHTLKGGNVAYGIETNLHSYSRDPAGWYKAWGQYKKTYPIMPEAFRDNQGGTCDPNSPVDVPALLQYEQSIGMGVLYWTLAPGIAITKAGLTTPTTYQGHTTINCPTGGPSAIDPNNTVGPGADLLAWFKANNNGDQKSPLSVSITNPNAHATVNGMVNVNVDTSSNVTRSQVDWDGNIIRNATSKGNSGWGAQWDSTKAPNGTHTLNVTVWDAAGDSKTASVTVNVQNQNAQLPPKQGSVPPAT